MKAAIFGAGRMGTAISWAMNELGWRVLAMDSSPDALHRLSGSVEGVEVMFSKHSDGLQKVIQEK